MAERFYLLNITVSGIKCIREEVRLDFYKKTVDKNFDPKRYRVKAIYGENGSGKSALITAVKIFRNLMDNRNYLNEPKTQEFLGEIVNKSTNAFRFSLEFFDELEDKKTVYQYMVHIGKGKDGLYEILYESLKWKNGSYANNKYTVIFESRNGELTEVVCTDREKERLVKRTMNLLSAHSFINLYFTIFRVQFITKENSADGDLYDHILTNLIFAISLKVYIAEEDQHELYFFQKRLKENDPDYQALVDGVFKKGNPLSEALGVNEKFVDKYFYEQYKEKVSRLTQFLKIFKSDLVSIDIDAKENGDQYVCDLNLNYGDYVINKEFESTGIKKLIRLFDCFMSASRGGIVFVDEMDSNLNDIYLCKLIEYFMYYGEGQLCFTTHNLDPMSVLKENKNSIDFLSSDNHLVPWTSRGNATPENCYRNGMIEDLPFNVEATDFVGILGE